MHKYNEQLGVTENVIHEKTLEYYVERALGQMHRSHHSVNDINTTLASKENGNHLAQLLIDELKSKAVRLEKLGDDEFKCELVKEVQSIINNFDGFNPENAFYKKFLELLKEFPYVETLDSIVEKKSAIAEKMSDVIAGILLRRTGSNISGGLNAFVKQFGDENEKVSFLRSGDAGKHIDKILTRRANDVVLMPCGGSNAFDVYRITFKDPETGLLKPSNIVVKFFKLGATDAIRSRAFRAKQEEFRKTASFFPHKTPKSIFIQDGSYIAIPGGSIPPFRVYQPNIIGPNIAESCQDPFLSKSMPGVIEKFRKAYRIMIETEKRALAVTGLTNGGIIIQRFFSNNNDDLVPVIVSLDGTLDMRDQNNTRTAEDFVRDLRLAQSGRIEEVLNRSARSLY